MIRQTRLSKSAVIFREIAGYRLTPKKSSICCSRLLALAAAVTWLTWVGGFNAFAQGALTNGWTHTGTIAPIGDSDSWTFSASAGESVVIKVGEISQTNAFTPRIRLQNPSAVVVASAQAGIAPEIVVTVTNSGTFTVIVDDAVGTTATGNYRLTLAKSPGDLFVAPGDEGGPLTNGFAHQALVLIGDLDVWSFTAATGDNLILRAGQINETNSNFYPWVRLYGPNGALLGSATDGATAEVVVRATNSGVFTVVFGNYPYFSESAHGRYLLTLGKTASPIVVSAGDEGGPLTNAVPYTCNMPIGDLDLWSFSATNGESLVLKVGQITETNNLAPWLRLYGPDGALVGSSWDTYSAEVAIRATNSGNFVVVIANYPYYTDAASGTYLLTLAKTGDAIAVTPGEESGPMTNGVAHIGNLPLGDLDVWNFPAINGQNLVLKVGQITETNNLALMVRLYGPGGALIASSWDQSAAEVAIKATNSGNFVVVIANYPYYTDAASGTYLLTLAKTGDAIVVSPGDEGGTVTNGVAHQGNLLIGDLDLWNFTATAGQNIIVRAGQITETNNLAPWVRLFGPDGALLASHFAQHSGEVAVRATNSGNFLIVIANNPYYTDLASGTYRLSFVRTGGPIEVSAGDQGGSLNGTGSYLGVLPVGDLDLYGFTACQGDFIDVRADELTDTNSFAPWLRLYGPTGALIGDNFGATFVRLALQTTNAGSFLLVVSNNDYYNNGGNGTYQLTANGLTAGLKLCIPVVAGTNVQLAAIGGVTSGTFILYTHTNLTTPLASWSPIWTNQFDQYGVYTRTNPFSKTEPERYFRLLVP